MLFSHDEKAGLVFISKSWLDNLIQDVSNLVNKLGIASLDIVLVFYIMPQMKEFKF